jgi:uncharacterized membrane protein
MDFRSLIELIVLAIELISVAILAVGVTFMLGRAAYRFARSGSEWPVIYRTTREGIGRVLLLGLEVLIAADIIKTVALDMTLENGAALGLIVLIRTFLSWAIEVETDGRWPWQATEQASNETALTVGSTESSRAAGSSGPR